MMKAVEVNLPQDADKSFIVFREKGTFFPAPWHYHPHYEFVLVLRSTGRRMVGDHIGYFNEGDLVFLGSLLPHVWVNDSIYLKGKAGHDADALVIHFTDDFLGGEFMHIPEMEKFRKVLELSERGMVLKARTRKTISALIKRMPEMSSLRRISCLLTIFDIIAESTEYDLLASPYFREHFHYPSSERFKRVTSHILNNFNKNISLQEIAGVANMGVTSFCQYFREQFRVTFVEYLNTVRIGHACKLLSENDYNITEIAYDCGFNSIANFNRQFKKNKLMSPGEYRKKLNTTP